MPGTDYNVASSKQLLGESTSKPCEIRGAIDAHIVSTNKMNKSLGPLRGAKYNDFNASNGQEEKVRALNRARGRSTLETKDSLPPASPNPKGSTKRHTGPGTTDIYFSPIDVTGSKVELSSPLPSPTPSLTPTQESFNASRAIQNAPASTSSTAKVGPSKKKLMIGREQLDRLVNALAHAPMIQQHVRKKLWEDDEATISEKPSMLSFRSALKELKPHDSAIALAKEQVGSPKRVMTKHETSSPTKAASVSKAVPVKLTGIALIDPKITGSPVRFLSKNYLQSTNVLRVGKQQYLNSPYGTDFECNLRVDHPPAYSNGRQHKVHMQVISQVLERKTARKLFHLVTELDVTESFTKAALTELTEQAGLGLDDVEVKSLAGASVSSTSSSDIDWCEMVDELQISCETDDLVDTAVEMYAHLETETCTMQTLTLMSEIERIKRKHQDFLVVRSHAEHKNGVPSQMSVPWMSHHLEHASLGDRPISADGAREFRDRLIASVAKRTTQAGPFGDRLSLAGEEQIVQCVPLVEGDSSKNVAWVCFIRDAADV